MSYEKNLGRVKGEEGVAFYPTATVAEDKVTIVWHCTDSEYTGTLPQSIDIVPLVYYPVYDQETGVLSWTKRTDQGLPQPMIIKGDRGEPGSIQLDVAFVEELPSVSNAQEGLIYFLSVGVDKYDTYVYESDKNKFIPLGLSSLDLSNYYTKSEIDAMFNNVYTKAAIDSLIGHVMELQDDILSIL